MHLHTEIYRNLKSISELFKIYMKNLDSVIFASCDNWISCNQTLGCLRLYGDSWVCRAQPRINAYEILLQHDWLFCFCFWFFFVFFFASCFEINVFYFTNLDKLFFIDSKTFFFLVITYSTLYLYFFSRHNRFAETPSYSNNRPPPGGRY